VTITGNHSFGPCVNLNNPLELRTGTASGTSSPVTRSCTDLLNSGGPTIRVIHWSTGTTSTFSYFVNSSIIAGGAIEIVETGSITAGEFAGNTAIADYVIANPDLTACGGAGVSQFIGSGVFTIAGA
jgi:hypothetical protein